MKPVLGGVVLACLSLLGAQFGMGPGPGTAHSAGVSTLMAFWEFNEGSGTTVTDHSTSGNNLTITAGSGSWTTQAGLSGGAYAFNSTRADSANATNVNFDFNQPFSVSVWFNQTGGTTEQALVSHLDTTANYRGWEIHYVSSVVSGCSNGMRVDFFLISTFPSNLIETSACPITTTNTLYNYVVTYDGSHTAAGVKFYQNGSLVASSPGATDTLTTTTTNAKVVRVGERLDASIPFVGKMGPIGVWNRVLTAGEATTIAGSPYAIVN